MAGCVLRGRDERLKPAINLHFTIFLGMYIYSMECYWEIGHGTVAARVYSGSGQLGRYSRRRRLGTDASRSNAGSGDRRMERSAAERARSARARLVLRPARAQSA